MHLPEFSANASLERSRYTYRAKVQYLGSASVDTAWRVNTVQPNQLENFSGIQGEMDADGAADLIDQFDPGDESAFEAGADFEGLSGKDDALPEVPGAMETDEEPQETDPEESR